MNKEYALMRDVITQYHPNFIKSKDLRRFGLSRPEMFNVERLVEESLAAVGGYNFVDEYGRDFDDPCNSDSKTVTVCCNSIKRSNYAFRISNVDTKIGSLRVTIYNPIKERVDFMYLPKAAVQEFKERDGTKSRESGAKERIRTNWNQQWDHYNKLDYYRVNSFVELAKKMD